MIYFCRCFKRAHKELVYWRLDQLCVYYPLGNFFIENSEAFKAVLAMLLFCFWNFFDPFCDFTMNNRAIIRAKLNLNFRLCEENKLVMKSSGKASSKFAL